MEPQQRKIHASYAQSEISRIAFAHELFWRKGRERQRRIYFYSLNAGDAIRSWLDGPRSRVYAYSYPDKTLLETLDGAARYRMKALHRAGNQILTIVKM